MLTATCITFLFNVQEDTVETALNDLNKKYRYMEVCSTVTVVNKRRGAETD